MILLTLISNNNGSIISDYFVEKKFNLYIKKHKKKNFYMNFFTFFAFLIIIIIIRL